MKNLAFIIDSIAYTAQKEYAEGDPELAAVLARIHHSLFQAFQADRNGTISPEIAERLGEEEAASLQLADEPYKVEGDLH